MKIFNSYAKYYDLLYKDKNYFSEVNYIEKFIKKFHPNAKTILDLGCGTGEHDFILAKKGYAVTGVELSSKMLEIAAYKLKNNKKDYPNLKFLHGDIRNISLAKKFDVIISLFHVLNYQTQNADLKSTLKIVSKHLKKNGPFIFDFWYGPAVLKERPESRIKKLQNKEIQIERIAIPKLRINENIVNVNYEIIIKELKNNKIFKVKETHNLRYFFVPEIKLFLEENGMEQNYCKEWMTGKELSDKSWFGISISRKK